MTLTIRLRTIVWTAMAMVLGALLAVAVMAAWPAEAAPGDNDATLVPITNCRLFDFRPGSDNVGPKDTPLGPGEANVYTQQVTGTNGNCTIPAGAVGVSMNVTITRPTAQSNLRVFPADASTPLASNLNWLPGQAPTPNKVDVRLSPGGAIKLFNQNGTVFVLADVVGYYTNDSLVEIDQRLAALESENAALAAKLASVTVEDVDGRPTVRFSGVNVQVLDGTGDTRCDETFTEPCNGLGNLIVGYAEDSDDPALRNGAHNIMVGSDNDYRSYGGFVAGRDNVVAGRFSSVTGGFANTASGPDSSVSGGGLNTAAGSGTSILGGSSNTANGNVTAVVGGNANISGGIRTVVLGGASNTATADAATTIGGDGVICGGSSTRACGEASLSAPD
ncbi:MAG: hypothetical protein AAFY28_08375 [Actinomycetota bacterium]